MKSILLLVVASTNAIMLEADLRVDGVEWNGPYTVTSADDEGFVIPK